MKYCVRHIVSTLIFRIAKKNDLATRKRKLGSQRGSKIFTGVFNLFCKILLRRINIALCKAALLFLALSFFTASSIVCATDVHSSSYKVQAIKCRFFDELIIWFITRVSLLKDTRNPCREFIYFSLREY